MSRLINQERKSALLRPLGENGWYGIAERDAIRKVFIFRNFADAWAWMSGIALSAEKMNHHPEWMNVYRTVDVTLTTHHAGGLTELDLQLAERMDTFASSFKSVEYQKDIEKEIACLCGLPEPKQPRASN